MLMIQGIWLLVGSLSFKTSQAEALNEAGLAEVDRPTKRSNNYFVQIGHGAVSFAESIYLGMQLVLGNRRFICTFMPLHRMALTDC